MPRFTLLPLLLALFISTQALGLPADEDDLLQNIGIYSPQYFAELQDVELQGDRAYVFGVGGMAVVDISDPTAPRQLGRYEPPGHPYNRFYRGAVEGNWAVGGGREDLLSIMTISEDGVPTLVSVHGAFRQTYEGAALRNGFIYACRHDEGLEIIDLNSKSGITTVSEVLSLSNSWDVALQGDLAYVADGIGGLAVVDIADPYNPVHLISVPTSSSATDVVVDGNKVVVSCGSAGVDIFTLDNPESPVLAGNANTSSLAITAALVGNTVYVADWDDVEAFDITDPSNPVAVGGEDTPTRAMGLTARDGLVLVADWSKLRTYSIGASIQGDIQVEVESMMFGSLPQGSFQDTTFTIGNTGGANIAVEDIQVFNADFSIITASNFIIPPGETREVGLRFQNNTGGYSGTFLRIDSNDTDEALITFPISGDDNPNNLNLGDPAPEFSLEDMGGVTHNLSDGLGRVVVVAFFANW